MTWQVGDQLKIGTSDDTILYEVTETRGQYVRLRYSWTRGVDAGRWFVLSGWHRPNEMWIKSTKSPRERKGYAKFIHECEAA